MQPASGTLIAHLNSGGPFLPADLYTLVLVGGTYRWTSYDQPITWGGNTWLPATDNGAIPLVKRGSIRRARGLEVQTTDITLSCGQSAQLGGVAMPLAAQNGAFDNGTVTIQRAFMSAPGVVVGVATLFPQGLVAGVDPSSTKVVLHLKNILEKLAVTQLPHVLFQPMCANLFGDGGCGLNRASYQVSGTVSGTPTTTSIPASALTQADGYFSLGVITFTSGSNAGASRGIQQYASKAFTLSLPLSNPPAAGDTFTVVPGCARQVGPLPAGQPPSCSTYANTNAFRGCPFVPPPVSAM